MPVFLEYIIVVALGLILGSFATALVYRVPRKIGWNKGRSACPYCSRQLEPRDLVPVFSWLSLGGKCRTCKTSIGTIYLWTEFLTLVACLGVYGAFGLTLQSIPVYAVMPFIAALFIIDLQTYTLPNQLVAITGALALVRLVFALFGGMTLGTFVMEYLMAGVIYTLVAWGLGYAMTRFLKKDALGMGDVKFFAAAGLWLGLGNLASFCIFSGLLGVGLGIAWKVLKKSDMFPFGPALILSLYLLLII